MAGSRRSFRVRVSVLVLLALAATSVAVVRDGRPAAAAERVLGGQLFATGDMVEVEVLPANAGLTSQLWLLEPQEVFIATNRDVGTTVSLGQFTSGDELVSYSTAASPTVRCSR